MSLPNDFDVVACDLHRLEREIAVEAARTLIETRALLVQVKEGPVSVYDISRLEPTNHSDGEMLASDLQAIARAAMYLGLLGRLVRVDADRPQLVAIREETAHA
jgi:hypothetical protein